MDGAKPAPPFKVPLAELARNLDELGVPYFVTGSIAVLHYGRPRWTHDIDLVALVTPEDVAELSACLPERYALDAVAATRSAEEGDHFNVIDQRTGMKVDFWPLAPTSYARTVMDRRRRMPLDSGEVWVIAVEDLVLSKLVWFLETDRDPKHWDDVLGIIEVSHSEIDRAYLGQWASMLGLRELLDAAEAASSWSCERDARGDAA